MKFRTLDAVEKWCSPTRCAESILEFEASGSTAG